MCKWYHTEGAYKYDRVRSVAKTERESAFARSAGDDRVEF